ncbi:hypothetical protein [Virgisporangium aurantiacum]|uniref:Uncharacterized protein n=1 Tax=Virgisporangium aurantiacum TaxID=175570 RepID=A0A8J4DYZ9_9ACTN|nr:hypothetical protein [Virgisporangium aurantiacum]GIJ56170.1 hypothetical protein Vau01_036860 [Virgisporangium aurantiacum]
MSESPGWNLDEEAQPTIADVSNIPLEIVFRTDDSALGHSIRKLLLDMNRQGENYAAHSQAV